MKLTIKINESSYDVEIGDVNTRPIMATLQGETYEVWPEETTVETVVPVAVKPVEAHPAPAVRSAPVSQPNGDVRKAIIAPIPGVIISISAKNGDNVSFGQEVCVLEAMKMKNSIKTTRAGKISAVKINTGDHVQHGQILFEFAD
ncbi:MAG: biotin/lipoyl-containing protein [Anaerolineaceae bacterium]